MARGNAHTLIDLTLDDELLSARWGLAVISQPQGIHDWRAIWILWKTHATR